MGPKLTQALRWFSHFSIRSRSFRHGRRPRRSPSIKHSTKWRLPGAVPPPLLWLRAPDTNSRGRDARLVFVSRFFFVTFVSQESAGQLASRRPHGSSEPGRLANFTGER